ncbi:EboA domain-containing protein [Streptomyces marianii]|uniref:Sugar phosphate isomerase n=1 Tax=Streptomyces marianii TaxID=1817406 RepID=A0A5R9DYW0_9ACTN|nr:EboA domain-containing protein [Streptomyces marianii]TLQ41945.1 sugar phosphate isomerase [Streptomyces marianii]
MNGNTAVPVDAAAVRSVEASLRSVLSPPKNAQLTAELEQLVSDPAALASSFPLAGRSFGREALPGRAGWTVDDAVRLLLLSRFPETGGRLVEEVSVRYRHGDAGERRGVLRALPFLPIGTGGLPLVEDALRTNDPRLLAAALGPYAQVRLDQHQWRHAVLKCLFLGVPLTVVAGLSERADPELALMAHSFADERRAAGRPVPADTWLITSHL